MPAEPPRPVQLWFTVEEWESLGEEDIAGAPPLTLAFGILRSSEAVIDVVAVTATGDTGDAGDAGVARERGTALVSARIAMLGALAVQLAHVRTHRVEGVRLVLFGLGALAEELADLVPVPRSPASSHPARRPADYPYQLFLAGLTAARRGPGVLVEICAEVARATSVTVSDGCGQLSHLSRDCLGRLEALVGAVGGPVSWTLTTSGWFALTPVSGRGFPLIRIRPVDATDLAADLLPSLAGWLATCDVDRSPYTRITPARGDGSGRPHGTASWAADARRPSR